MTTKLEGMVDYLAGRDADPALLDELANPSSEASRFLEAARSRSRALLDQAVSPGGSTVPAVSRPDSRKWLVRVGWSSVGLLILGMTFWIGETRFRRFEAALERAGHEARARSEQIEATLSRLVEAKSSALVAMDSIQSTLAKLDAGLGRLDGKFEKLASPDPTIAEIRDQMAAIRRELASSEKASTRQVEDIQGTVHEVNRLIRILINRSQPPAPVNEAPPRRNP